MSDVSFGRIINYFVFLILPQVAADLAGTLCPIILPARVGNYALPVAVAENLTLITKNIPPPVSPIFHCYSRLSEQGAGNELYVYTVQPAYTIQPLSCSY